VTVPLRVVAPVVFRRERVVRGGCRGVQEHEQQANSNFQFPTSRTTPLEVGDWELEVNRLRSTLGIRWLYTLI